MCAERESAVSPAVAVALILALTTLVAGIVTVTVLSGGLSFVVKDAKEVQVSVDIAGDTAVLSIVSGKDLPMMSSYTVIVTDINGVAYNGTLPYPAVKSVKFPMNSGEVGSWIAEIEASGVTVPSDVKTEVTAAVEYLSKILNVNNISQIAVVGHFTDGISEVVFLGQVKPGAVVEPITPATQYTITFNANGGSGTMQNAYVSQGESLTLPLCTFTKTHAYFGGWDTSASGHSVVYSDKETIPVSSNLNLYAVWMANVTFDKNNDGAAGTMPEQAFVCGVAKNLNKNTFIAPTGQKFSAWSENKVG
ncbi:MAG: InlB B-repeat-containing protein [Methanocorpusculum sp.]|nr:InlB B-repeat-containing protein [Methanocorpusculum sp.]